MKETTRYESLIDGHGSLEAIIQSALTGDASHLTGDYRSDGNESMSSERKELLKKSRVLFKARKCKSAEAL